MAKISRHEAKALAQQAMQPDIPISKGQCFEIDGCEWIAINVSELVQAVRADKSEKCPTIYMPQLLKTFANDTCASLVS